MKLIKYPAQIIRQIIIVLATLLLVGCATNSILPSSPKVSLSSAKLSKLGINEQLILFTLNVSNANRFPIPLLSTDFVAKINGIEVANGISDHKIELAANADTQVPITVSANLFKSTTEFIKALSSGGLNFDYELNGKLTVDTPVWPLGIPYNVKGNLLSKTE